MATINGSVSQRSDSYSFYIDWSESLPSDYIITNKTVVSATAYIYCSAHTAYGSNYPQKLTIDGTEFTDTKSINLSPGVTVALISGSKTIEHNPNGSKSITISADCDLPDGGGWGPAWGSASGTVDLTTIPRQANVTSATDFNDEGNPTITYNNPGGFRINARLEFAGTNIRRDNISNTESYTFNLTSSERTLLRQKCTGNSMTVREVIATCIGGTTETHWSYLDKKMTIVNGNPTFSNYEFEDIKPESLLLTGNNQYLINNYNTLQVTISSENKAIANKEATMSKYRLVCNNNSIEANYSNNSDVTLTLQNVTSMQFTVYAIDSRGNSTSITKSAEEWINYSPIAIATGNAARTGGVGTETTLTFEGTMWKTEEQYDFGAVSNEITLCQYQFKKSNESTYGEPINITPVVNNNNFSFNSTIRGDEGTSGAEGFNLSNAYNIKITIADKISTYSYDVLLGSGKPQMAIAPRRSFIWRTL